MEEPKEWSHTNGRPKTHEKHAIDQLIRDYYLKGIDPAYVIQETHFNKNTVYNKYKKYDLEIERAEEKDFIKKHQQKQSQFRLSLDHLLMKSYDVLSHIEKKLDECKKKGDALPADQVQKFLDVGKFILVLKKEKNQSLGIDDKDLKERTKKILKETEDD